jgi:plasmid stabilization system protein ParE
MTRVALTRDALGQLEELIATRSLPEETRGRVARSIQPLRDFPELGAELGGSFTGRRFLLGPWRWMVIIYRHYPESDLVAVLAIVDGRSSTSPLANR